MKVETSKALKGLSVRKQYEVDQVLDTLRSKGIYWLTKLRSAKGDSPSSGS